MKIHEAIIDVIVWSWTIFGLTGPIVSDFLPPTGRILTLLIGLPAYIVGYWRRKRYFDMVEKIRKFSRRQTD